MISLDRGRAGEKRRRILEAARFLVLRNGLRSTTIEAIAREAGIAKPTLYVQFADKEAVFAAMIEDMVETVCGAFDVAIAGEASLAERLGEALAAKFCAIARLLEGSPHANELFGEHHRTAARFKALDMQTETAVATALTESGVADATGLARLIIASAYGITQKLGNEDAVREGIMLMCKRLIDPVVR